MTSRGTRYWSSGSIPLIAPELLGDIIASASDIAVVISDLGQVLSVLTQADPASFGHLDRWEGRDIREILTKESIPKLDAALERIAVGGTEARPIELNHGDGRSEWEVPVRYTIHRVGPDGALLMLGRDLRPIAEMQQQLVKAQLALEKDYETQRDVATRLRVLLEATRDPLVVVAQGSGRIAEISASAARILGAETAELREASFAAEFDGAEAHSVIDRLSDAAQAGTATPVSLMARRSGRVIEIGAEMFRSGGERMLLCRLDAGTAVERPPETGSPALSAFFESGADAMVFADAEGTITAANDSFLDLCDAATDVKGRSLADFLARGSVDARVLIDNARRNGRMRLYSTKLAAEHGAQVPVEISATWLADRKRPAIAFVIRDVSRAETVRGPGRSADDDARSVMELVGSATLKDIVAETTEVVERMCIETAVELTNNNRVAAAEMLGLSRQSLYVKLRKYGLLSRGG